MGLFGTAFPLEQCSFRLKILSSQCETITGRAPEVGATIGLYDPKAIRDELNGWRVVALGLTQTSHGSLAALGAPQFFFPVIDHATDISLVSPGWPGTFPQIVNSRDCSSPAR